MISGYVHPDFGAVTEALRKVATHKQGGGAAVAVYHQGEVVVDAWTGARNAAGDPWQPDTMVMSFSTTKGVVATTVHRLVDRGLIDYDEPVCTYWPEFAAGGKEHVTVRNLLDHSAGLHQLRGVISNAYEMLDWDLVCSRLAAESPRYPPGTRHGYHGVTFGFLVGEVIRRVTGLSVHDAVEAEIVQPLGLDGMSIGAPPDLRDRVAELITRPANAERAERFALRAGRAAWMRPAVDAFMVPGSEELFASFDVLDAEIPAANGCFTARSLARMYAALAGRRSARRSALSVRGDLAARHRDPVDPAATSCSACRCVGDSATTRPPRRRASSPTGSGTSASVGRAPGPTPTTTSRSRSCAIASRGPRLATRACCGSAPGPARRR